MNTRQKLEEFREVRRAYMADCREEYGYRPRTEARVLGSSNGAGFVSALFGCAFMIAAYATFDLTAAYNTLHVLAANLLR